MRRWMSCSVAPFRHPLGVRRTPCFGLALGARRCGSRIYGRTGICTNRMTPRHATNSRASTRFAAFKSAIAEFILYPKTGLSNQENKMSLYYFRVAISRLQFFVVELGRFRNSRIDIQHVIFTRHLLALFLGTYVRGTAWHHPIFLCYFVNDGT
jgi:hypothetical protein